MKKVVLLVSVVALFAISCERSPEVADGVTKHRLTATTESSRTTLGDDEKVLWSDGEQILVLATMADASVGDIAPYSLVEGAGTTNGVFEGSLASTFDTYSAFYPISMYQQATTAGQILFLMPVEGIVLTERNFVDGANPMYATGSADEGLEFRNLCGILELPIKGKGRLTSISLQTTYAISGYFLVQGGSTYMYRIEGYDQYGSIEATISPAIELSESTPRSIYIILPPNIYPTMTIVTTDSDGGSTSLTTDNAINITRSHITPVSAFTHNGSSQDGDDDDDDEGDNQGSLEDPTENPEKDW